MSPPPVLGTIMVLYSGTTMAQPCLLGFCESYGDPTQVLTLSQQVRYSLSCLPSLTVIGKFWSQIGSTYLDMFSCSFL